MSFFPSVNLLFYARCILFMFGLTAAFFRWLPNFQRIKNLKFFLAKLCMLEALCRRCWLDLQQQRILIFLTCCQAVLQITDFITSAHSVPLMRLPFFTQRIAACFQFILSFSTEMKGEGKYITTTMTIL